jgi:hypothetical protein
MNWFTKVWFGRWSASTTGNGFEFANLPVQPTQELICSKARVISKTKRQLK